MEHIKVSGNCNILSFGSRAKGKSVRKEPLLLMGFGLPGDVLVGSFWKGEQKKADVLGKRHAPAPFFFGFWKFKSIQKILPCKDFFFLGGGGFTHICILSSCTLDGHLIIRICTAQHEQPHSHE